VKAAIKAWGKYSADDGYYPLADHMLDTAASAVVVFHELQGDRTVYGDQSDYIAGHHLVRYSAGRPIAEVPGTSGHDTGSRIECRRTNHEPFVRYHGGRCVILAIFEAFTSEWSIDKT